MRFNPFKLFASSLIAVSLWACQDNELDNLQSNFGRPDIELTTEETFLLHEVNQMTLMVEEISAVLAGWQEDSGSNELVFDELVFIVPEVSRQAAQHVMNESELSFCASYDLDPDNKRVVLNFASGCASAAFPQTRAGQLIINFSGTPAAGEIPARPFAGSKFIQLQNYTVGNRSIQGSLGLSPAMPNQQGYSLSRNTNLTIESLPAAVGLMPKREESGLGESLAEMDLTFEEESVPPVKGPVTYNAFHMFTYLNQDTTTPTDDVILVSGSAFGSNAWGLSYRVNIQRTLSFSTSCSLEGVKTPNIGEIKISIGVNNFHVDYGVNQCSNQVSIRTGATATSQMLTF